MREKKIFLASSSELKEERKSFARFIREINEAMKQQNIELKGEQWEFKDKAIQGQRIQDMYNETLANCEICVVLFWTKCGKYSQEELDFAYKKFMEGLNPRKIFVFFRNDDSKKASNELIEFKKDFSNRFKENFPSDYSNVDELRFNLFLQIAMYLGNDSVSLNFNNRLIDCTKLPCFINNTENSEVLESYKKASENAKKYPKDKSFKQEKALCEKKLNDILAAVISTAKMMNDFTSNVDKTSYNDVNKAIIHYYQQCKYDEVRKIIEKINNPFIISGDINSEFFCDRIIAGEKLEKHLLHEDNIILVAPRRAGKTAFIRNRLLNSSLRQTHYFVYCDLYTTNCIDDFASILTDSITRDIVSSQKNGWKSFINTLKSLSPSFGIDSYGNIEFSITASEQIKNPIKTIGDYFNMLEKLDRPCVVCFDEFQSLKNDNSGKIEELVYKYMKRLKNVRFVFIWSPRFYSNFSALGINHSIIENSTFFILEPIKKEDYFIFAQHWFKAYSKIISDGAFSLVFDFCQGRPYYIQIVLHRLFIEVNSGETCHEENVSIVLNSLIREYTPLFQQKMFQLRQIEKTLLYYLSVEGVVEDINTFIKKYDSLRRIHTNAKYSFERLINNEWISYYDNKFYIENVFFCKYLKNQMSTIQSQ